MTLVPHVLASLGSDPSEDEYCPKSGRAPLE
jgi:hypothetical protein